MAASAPNQGAWDAELDQGAWQVVVATPAGGNRRRRVLILRKLEMELAKQSTAKTFLLGPILDTDGAAKTDEVVASIKVTKNGTVGAVDAQDTLAHNHTGHYVFVSDGGDFDTLGEVEFSLNSGTNAMAPVKFQVLPAATYDALIANGAGLAGGLLIAGSNAATTFANLTVSGTSALGAVTATTITASGAVALQSTVTVTGITTFAATTFGSIAVTSGVSIGTTLAVAGTVTFNALAVTTTTTLTGAVSLGSTLAITGAVTAPSITLSGALQAATIVSTGTTTLNALTVTGACTHGSTVLGNTIIGTLGIGIITQVGTVSWGATTWASVAITSGTMPANVTDIVDAVWDEVLHTDHEVAGSASVLLQGATAPTAASVADAVWDEVLHTDHEVASSASVLLQAAGGAADPLLNAVPGSYAAGTAGEALGKIITRGPSLWYRTPATQTVAISEIPTTPTDPDATLTIDASNFRCAAMGGHMGRIRQWGSLTGVRLYVKSTTASYFSILKFRVFRYVSGKGAAAVWNQVGSDSDDVASQITATAGWKTLTFTSPITGCQPGDIICIDVTSAAGGAAQVGYWYGGQTANDFALFYTAMGARVSGAGISFSEYAETYFLALEGHMTAPTCVTAGDSFFADLTRSHCWALSSGDWEDVTEGQDVASLLRAYDSTLFNVQNIGKGSSTTQGWDETAGWTAKITGAYPKFALLHLGINDCSTSRTFSQWKNNMISLLQKLVAVEITPVVLSINSMGDTAYPAATRSWNDWLETYCKKCGYTFINTEKVMASYANLDIRNTTAFGATSHPTLPGYKAIARMIADTLMAKGW